MYSQHSVFFLWQLMLVFDFLWFQFMCSFSRSYHFFFFFNDTATTEIYTLHIVGSVRCVQETVCQVLFSVVMDKKLHQAQLIQKNLIQVHLLQAIQIRNNCQQKFINCLLYTSPSPRDQA
eukprot:TRINITY_DN5102_c0_g1_i1.p1 TRINITY_DN5102_c0_g1~~TRINITY_DN5102_c0_g1_i1.p1  ORF type:complete len:120 (-),score=17.84 TRINITY_DN5102_c0_g1_i1:77-436(-)